MKDTDFCQDTSIRIRGSLLALTKPVVMGILNLTHDSFYAGSRISNEETLLKKAAQMIEEGATFLDVGACSTRPGAAPVPESVELERMVKAITSLCHHFPEAIISADTYRSSVAIAAVNAGAAMINDVSGGSMDGAMFSTVAHLGVPYILMHMRGTPETMAGLNNYTDLIDEICLELSQKINQLHLSGVSDIILDPGFGFSKNPAQNLELLARMEEFKLFNLPVLVGISRKSTVWKTLNITPEEALNGSTVLHTLALQKGANILRTHDVKPAVEAIKLWQQVHQYER